MKYLIIAAALFISSQANARTLPTLNHDICFFVGWSVAPENPQQSLYLGKCPPADRSMLGQRWNNRTHIFVRKPRRMG
jgi:hypothetical protein